MLFPSVNIGKWVLAHLFDKFIKREIEHQEEGLIRFGDEHPDRPDSVKSRTLQTPAPAEDKSVQDPTTPAVPSISIPPNAVDTDGPKLPLTAVTTNVDQSPYLPSSPQAAQFNGPFTAPIASTTQSDYFSGAHHPPVRRESSVQLPPAAALPTSPISPTSSNFMNRLKSLSVKAKLSRIPTNEDKFPTTDSLVPSSSTSTSLASQQQQQAAAAAAVAAAEKAAAEAKAIEEANKLKEIEESKSESYIPPSLEDFPPLEIPSSTMIIVAEESAEASTGMDLYRGTVGSSGEDADTIIDVAPSWLLSYLLYVSSQAYKVDADPGNTDFFSL
jgi:WD repeat-containing protein 48